MRVMLAMVLTLLLIGCAQAPMRQGFADAGQAPAAAAPEDTQLSESLFKEDQKVISNEDVQRILSAKIALPEDGKMAVVRAGRLPYWFGWAEDFTRLNRQIDQQFLDKV
jgi:hypothetical protein